MQDVPRASRSSAITHAHIRSQLACSLHCLIAQRLLAGETIPLAYQKALSSFRPIIAAHPGEQTHFERLLSGRLPDEPRTSIRSGGYVLDTIEASIWCLHRHQDFVSTVLAAVNLAGDTDTTACVTGGLAGIHYAASSIPSEWKESLPRQAELKDLFARFLNACDSPGIPG